MNISHKYMTWRNVYTLRLFVLVSWHCFFFSFPLFFDYLLGRFGFRLSAQISINPHFPFSTSSTAFSLFPSSSKRWSDSIPTRRTEGRAPLHLVSISQSSDLSSSGWIPVYGSFENPASMMEEKNGQMFHLYAFSMGCGSICSSWLNWSDLSTTPVLLNLELGYCPCC